MLKGIPRLTSYLSSSVTLKDRSVVMADQNAVPEDKATDVATCLDLIYSTDDLLPVPERSITTFGEYGSVQISFLSSLRLRRYRLLASGQR